MTCEDRSDFGIVDTMHFDPLCKPALGIKPSPSAPRLRPGFNEDAETMISPVDAAIADFIASAQAPITVLSDGQVTIDMNVVLQDNRKPRRNLSAIPSRATTNIPRSSPM